MRATSILAGWEAWPLFRRYVKFCIVGGSGLVVDMGILWLLSDPSMLGWNLTLGKVIAAEVAIFNNFTWNEIWTFRGLNSTRSGWHARWIRLGKFNLICVAGIGLSVALLNSQVYWLDINVYVANFIAIVAVSIWNFLLALKLGWKEPLETGGRISTADERVNGWRKEDEKD